MKKWLVERQKDKVVVTILKNKKDNTYLFINLTKEHICPCRFPSVEAALKDMDAKIVTGEIVKYTELIN